MTHTRFLIGVIVQLEHARCNHRTPIAAQRAAVRNRLDAFRGAAGVVGLIVRDWNGLHFGVRCAQLELMRTYVQYESYTAKDRTHKHDRIRL
jgi:hypothetical protein